MPGAVEDQTQAAGGQGAEVDGDLISGRSRPKSRRTWAWSAMTKASFASVLPSPRLVPEGRCTARPVSQLAVEPSRGQAP